MPSRSHERAAAVTGLPSLSRPVPSGRDRTWRPGWPVDPALILGTVQRGRTDPCCRLEPDGTAWWATRSPAGPVLVRISARPEGGEVQARAWGPGADWALDGLPELLGTADDPQALRPEPGHPRLVEASAQHAGWRVPRTRAVLETLIAVALSRPSGGTGARRAWRILVSGYGEPAPGSGRDVSSPALGMRIPPAPADWADIPAVDWLAAGVDDETRRLVITVAGLADRVQSCADLPPERARAALAALPGVSLGIAAQVGQRAFGDADAFDADDPQLAADVSWGLVGRVLDPEACAALMAGYAGQRYRVQRLLELAEVRAPRRELRPWPPAPPPPRR